MVAGFLKAYNLPLGYVLYDLSYVNMVMYSTVIPSYNPKRDEMKEKHGEIIRVDDPRNREKVRNFLENIE